MHDNRRDESTELRPTDDEKRPYNSPVLTEFGSVEHLVDGGVMGTLVVLL